MSKEVSIKLKNFFVIIFICLVFFIVCFIFYTEITKNQKINNAKKNFYEVKKELIKNTKLCKDKSKISTFGQLCLNFPDIKDIDYYFNISNHMFNPYDLNEGVNGSPGSVLIVMIDNKIQISVDIDANGGIDIEHIIKLP